MIAIDTNVLLRYLLADDASQHSKACNTIKTLRPVLIVDAVLAETVWTLTGKRYRLDKSSICSVIRTLLGDGVFVFEDSQVIWSALCDYDESKSIRGKALDFVDALIFHKSHAAAKNKDFALKAFYSFDKALAQLPGSKSP